MAQAQTRKTSKRTAKKASKPGRPAAKAAPPKGRKKAPGKPGKPGKPAVASAPEPASDTKTGKPGRPRAVQTTTGSADKALLAELETLKAEFAKQSEMLAKAKARTSQRGPRHVTDIVSPGEDPTAWTNVADDDWRLEYHGLMISVRGFTQKFAGGNVDTDFSVDDDGVTYPALLAIPRDSDRDGAVARHCGRIAVHYAFSEDGMHLNDRRVPFVSAEQLAEIWDDDVEPQTFAEAFGEAAEEIDESGLAD